MSPIDLSAVPPVRVQALARYAAAARAQAIARMPPPRRHATLLAFAKVQETAALDDVVDLLDQLITAMLARVERAGQQRRLRTLKDLDAAALLLHEACLVLLDPGCADRRVRDTVFARVPRDQLTQAVAQVADLVGPPDDHYFEDLRTRYSQVRRFLPALLEAVEFAATDAGRPATEAFRFLKTIEGQKRPDMSQAPQALLTPAWKRVVIGPEGRIDRQLYTFCVLERLQDGLRRRDLFVPASRRWGDPYAKLLQGPAWEKVRSRVCRTLGRSPTAAAELESLGKQLDEAYRRTANNLPTNSAVTIERDGRRDVLTLTPLDKLDEPASLVDLRRDVTARLPRVDLTEVLLEVLAWTNFAAEFRHVSEGDARVGDLDLSLCAVLLAEACNIGLEPLVRPDVPALTRGRLSWVQQNYIRAETITKANARLVDYQAQIPLAQAWGGGEVASADGLRFVVPVRTLNAGPNPKYFNTGRGVTYYNFTSDQFTGFHAIVVPGTIRDSLFILEGLLEQQTGLRPHEVMSDTAGYSDLVFGLFWLLGYQFSPRLADFGESRFWRMDPKADYGALNGLARQRINIPRIDAELGRPAAGGRLAEDGDRQCLGADPRPAGRRPPLDAGPGHRRAGPRGQDAVPAELPGRRGVSPPHPHPAQPGREPARRGAGDLPRPAGRTPAALPRRPGGPTGGAGAGGQCGGALEHPLSGRRPGPGPRLRRGRSSRRTSNGSHRCCSTTSTCSAGTSSP